MERNAYPPDMGRPGITEEVRQHGSAAGRGDAPPELGHQRGDAGHLADHDDGRPAADPVDVPSRPARFERLLLEVVERAFPSACLAGRHGRTVASSAVAGPARSLDPRLPVLAGLGTADDAAPVVDLMTAAVRAAADDAGAPGILRAVDAIVVPQGTWAIDDPARAVAQRIGAPQARTVRCEIGVSQQEVINYALAAVSAGTLDAVVVVGAEARAWARAGGVETEVEGAPPDEVLRRPPDFVAPVELAAGIVVPPVQQYAMIENALGAAEGLSTEAQRDEVAALWARFNTVAGDNPDAAFRRAAHRGRNRHTRDARNRPLAFPYNVRHASQWTVDQASALLICSAERAPRRRASPPTAGSSRTWPSTVRRRSP